MALRVYSEIVERAVTQYADKSALFIKRGDNYQQWTYSEFSQDISRTVSAMKDRGVTEEHNAIVIGANTPEWIIAFHAAFFAGNCAVPVDPNLPAEDIEEILTRVKAKTVFCDPAYIPLFESLAKKYDFCTTIVVLTGAVPDAYTAVSWSDFANSGDPQYPIFDRTFSPEDPISLLFTSGTTGKSKGAVLLQKNYCSTVEYAAEMMEVTTDDRILAVLPLYHVFGFAATIAGALMCGIDVVCIPEVKGPLIVSAMKELKVTALPAVPQMLTLILESIRRGAAEKGAVTKLLFNALLGISGGAASMGGKGVSRKLFKSVHQGFGGKFRLIISGGASLDKRSFAAYQALGFDIVEGYGLTETMGPITLCPLTDQIQGSVGKTIGENEVKIENPDSAGWGEVLFRGDSVFGGYLDNEKATAEVFDSEGWFHTGDRGRLDGRGFLYLSGRLKDMIVLDSGKNVYPDELEHYYESSSLIEEIGVFALQEQGRTAVAAVVVPRSHGRSGTDEEFEEKMHDEMIRLGANRPDYKRVGPYVISWHPLARTSTKKIKKHLLPKLYSQIKKGEKKPEPIPLTAVQTLLMESELYRSVCSAIQEVAPQKLSVAELTPERELLRDLGVDSLRLLDLVAMLDEKLHISVDEKALSAVVTIEDLVVAVRDSSSSSKKRDIHTLLENYCRDNNVEFEDKKGVGTALALRGVSAMTSLLWGFHVEGLENVPGDRPVIFASNHESLLDGVWLYAALPASIRRRTYALVKAELMDSPVMKSLISGANIVAVERDGDILTPLQVSYAALKAGRNIVIYPEGTRSTDGVIHEFRSGVGILMRESGASVVPVRVVNAGKKFPKGKGMQVMSGWKDRPVLTFGKPVTLESLGLSNERNEDKIAAAIRNRVESL